MFRILVLRGGALGDLIVTLPALAALRHRWPDSHLELIGNATAAELARAAKLVDVVHSQHAAKWANFYSAEDLPRDLENWSASFDLVVNFWPDPAGDLARKFPLRDGQIFVSASSMPQIAPAAAHYQDALAQIGVKARKNAFDLSPYFSGAAPDGVAHTPNAIQRNEPRLRVAIHAGSGSSRKNWPKDRWTEIARWLRDECEAELVIISGEAEALDDLPALGTSARNLPLGELATILRRCRLFLGHDSGVSHLAAAMGVECILLFGPTDPAMWAPPQPRVRVLKSGEHLDAISVPQVQAAVNSAFSDRK